MPLCETPDSVITDPHVGLTRKPTAIPSEKHLSSKWEEAEKWVKNSHLHSIHPPRTHQHHKEHKKINGKQFGSPPSMTEVLSDKNPQRNFTKGFVLTETTEISSREISCHKSKKISSTTRNTQAVLRNIGVFDGGSTNSWNPREERKVEREEATTPAPARNSSKRNECCIRCRREEAKIRAWVNLQDAKVEAELKRLELKIERMRSSLEEKLMKRVETVANRAEKWRTEAQASHAQHQISSIVSRKSERRTTIDGDSNHHDLPAYFC